MATHDSRQGPRRAKTLHAHGVGCGGRGLGRRAGLLGDALADAHEQGEAVAPLVHLNDIKHQRHDAVVLAHRVDDHLNFRLCALINEVFHEQEARDVDDPLSNALLLQDAAELLEPFFVVVLLRVRRAVRVLHDLRFLFTHLSIFAAQILNYEVSSARRGARLQKRLQCH